LIQHYGSGYAMTDYTAQAHNLYLTGSFMATPKMTFTGSVNYNLSKGEFDEVDMSYVREALTEDTLPHQNFDFSEVNAYSSIEYGILELGLGMEYRLAPRFTLSANAQYADLNDETGYVYGIESGSYFFVSGGVRIDF